MAESDPPLFAWIGEDEFTRGGAVGLKQALVPAGRIPLVATARPKIDRGDVIAQLQRQADQFGKPIRLVQYVAVETLIVLTPRPQG